MFMNKNSKIVITGSGGFIGRNLKIRLFEDGFSHVVSFDRANSVRDLAGILKGASCVFHLAGVNRPVDINEFKVGNVGLTQLLVETLDDLGEFPLIILTSSTQATKNNHYGESKLAAEEIVGSYAKAQQGKGIIIRLPNVFGKWCKPNYNSVVATFCHNVVNGLPLKINDASAELELVYIDDVCDTLLSCLNVVNDSRDYREVVPSYKATVGELASTIENFKESRNTLISRDVGSGLERALHASYLSYLTTDMFSYKLLSRKDPRGEFSEVLKTNSSGQFSVFTAFPGITRGGHYHHTKTEKFIVVSGVAKFRFRHVLSGEVHEIRTTGNEYEVVETVPGWAHDVTNIGETELIVLLWANEIFDKNKPDTVMCEL